MAAFAQSCTGRFVNPLTDVCWECLFPISIGSVRMGRAAGAPDTPNPSSPICNCGLRIGLSIGLWEPARLIDVSRTPYCFPNLGGLTVDPGFGPGQGRTGSSGGDGSSGSVWHVHYYFYPLLSWIGALLDLGCMESGGLDIAWVSELDPTWNDEELAFLLNPGGGAVHGICRRKRLARPIVRRLPPGCRWIRCSGARGARAGCTR